MNRIDAPTPSAVLFEKLQIKIAPTKEQLAILKKRKRVDIPDDNVRALVVGLNGHQLTYVPQVDTRTHTPIPENLRQEQVIDVAFINMPSAYGTIGVRNRAPDSIGIVHENNSERVVNFVAGDPYLDKILSHGLHQFPKVETAADLEGLTNWVHKKLPYSKGAIGFRDADVNLSLGDFIEQYGPVCRHLSAVEFAILQLHEIDANPISTKVYSPKRQLAALMSGDSSDAGSHIYLQVNLYGNDSRNVIHTDPTSSITGDSDAFRLKNESWGYFFRDEIELKFQGKWNSSNHLASLL